MYMYCTPVQHLSRLKDIL